MGQVLSMSVQTETWYDSSLQERSRAALNQDGDNLPQNNVKGAPGTQGNQKRSA